MTKLTRDSHIGWAPQKTPFYYGWAIIVLGTVGILMSAPGQTIGVSTFTEPLLKALSISRHELSLMYMCGTIASSFVLTYAGRFYDKHGATNSAAIAALGLGIILVYMSQIDRIVSFLTPQGNIFFIFPTVFLGFLMMRFFGQGFLTLVSRNMMAKWFDAHRGFAMSFSNIFVSLGFSYSPVLFDHFMQFNGWRGAWLILAGILLFIFIPIVLIFFKDRPEAYGLKADGNLKLGKKIKPVHASTQKQFTLSEAKLTLSFWVFALTLAMQALYVTAFTFHVESIFDQAGYSRDEALAIFFPSSLIAVILTFTASWLSDYIQLKYLLMFKCVGAFISITGLVLLQSLPEAYYLIIIGNGLVMGVFGVLSTVTWPRFYGNQHLGAISGLAMTFMVFASALGPVLFSLALDLFGGYEAGGWLCFSLFFILFVLSFWAHNPQKIQH